MWKFCQDVLLIMPNSWCLELATQLIGNHHTKKGVKAYYITEISETYVHLPLLPQVIAPRPEDPDAPSQGVFGVHGEAGLQISVGQRAQVPEGTGGMAGHSRVVESAV